MSRTFLLCDLSVLAHWRCSVRRICLIREVGVDLLRCFLVGGSAWVGAFGIWGSHSTAAVRVRFIWAWQVPLSVTKVGWFYRPNRSSSVWNWFRGYPFRSEFSPTVDVKLSSRGWKKIARRGLAPSIGWMGSLADLETDLDNYPTRMRSSGREATSLQYFTACIRSLWWRRGSPVQTSCFYWCP